MCYHISRRNLVSAHVLSHFKTKSGFCACAITFQVEIWFLRLCYHISRRNLVSAHVLSHFKTKSGFCACAITFQDEIWFLRLCYHISRRNLVSALVLSHFKRSLRHECAKLFHKYEETERCMHELNYMNQLLYKRTGLRAEDRHRSIDVDRRFIVRHFCIGV